MQIELSDYQLKNVIDTVEYFLASVRDICAYESIDDDDMEEYENELKSLLVHLENYWKGGEEQ